MIQLFQTLFKLSAFRPEKSTSVTFPTEMNRSKNVTIQISSPASLANRLGVVLKFFQNLLKNF